MNKMIHHKVASYILFYLYVKKHTVKYSREVTPGKYVRTIHILLVFIAPLTRFGGGGGRGYNVVEKKRT